MDKQELTQVTTEDQPALEDVQVIHIDDHHQVVFIIPQPDTASERGER